MEKKNYYYNINDGYGIVGHGYECLKCEEDNNFVSDDAPIQTCEYCGAKNHF